MKRVNAAAYMQFSDPRAYTMVALGMTIGIVLLSRMIERSRFGMSLIAIKQNEAAAEAAGINTLLWKLRAITLSGALAGGGRRVLCRGAAGGDAGIGVRHARVRAGPDGDHVRRGRHRLGSADRRGDSHSRPARFSRPSSARAFPASKASFSDWPSSSSILAAPEGIFWRVRDLVRRHSAPQPVHEEADAAASFRRAGDRCPCPSPVMPQPGLGKVILAVRNLSKSFGGLKAVQDVSFDVHARLDPRHHRAKRRRQDDAVQPAQRLSRVPTAAKSCSTAKTSLAASRTSYATPGVGRTFQVMRPFPRLSVADNVVIGAYVHSKNDDDAAPLARRRYRRASGFPILPIASPAD